MNEDVEALCKELESLPYVPGCTGVIDRAITALRRNARDAERLAWLDAQVSGYAAPDDPYEHAGNSWRISGQFASISDAIDYHMQQENLKTAQHNNLKIDCPVCGKTEPISCGMCADAALSQPVQVTHD